MQTRLELARNGRWEVRYTEKLANGAYRTRTVSTRESDRRAAESFQQVFETQLSQAQATAGAATFGDCLDVYLAKPLFRNKPSSDKSILAYEQLRRGLGDLAIVDINDALVRRYVADNGWSDGTARKMISQIKAVINHAHKTKLIKADDIPYLERPAASPPRDKWLDEAAEAEFYALALGDSIGKPRLTRITLFTCIGLDTAQRRMAIIPLRWSQVDFQAGLIDFRKKGATSKKQSVVPISKRLRPLLERAYAERINDYVLDSATELATSYRNFCGRVGYGWVTAHVLRHSWATLALRAGVDIWEVAGVLGNTAAMVEAVYGHHCPQHLRSAIDKRAF